MCICYTYTSWEKSGECPTPPDLVGKPTGFNMLGHTGLGFGRALFLIPYAWHLLYFFPGFLSPSKCRFLYPPQPSRERVCFFSI